MIFKDDTSLYHMCWINLININYDSYMMPRKIGDEIPHRMAFTFTPQNRKDVQEAMNSKNFSSVAECINTAMRFYFENRNKTAITKEWLLSEEGREFIKDIARDEIRDR